MTTFFKTKGRTAVLSLILAAVLSFTGVFAVNALAQDIRTCDYYGDRYDMTKSHTVAGVDIEDPYARTAENGVLVRMKIQNPGSNVIVWVGEIKDNSWIHCVGYPVPKGTYSTLSYCNLLVPYTNPGSLTVTISAIDNASSTTTLYYADNVAYHGKTDYLSYDTLVHDCPPMVKKAKSLVKKKKSTTSKVLAIHKYICTHFTYDYNKASIHDRSLWGSYSWSQKSDVTWQTKKGVCQDLAILEAAMLRSVNIPADVVNNDDQTHAWVKAKINGTWKDLDPTADLGKRSFTAKSVISPHYRDNGHEPFGY